MASEAPGFTGPGHEINQGDIIVDVPWGLVEHPLTICRPLPPARNGANARAAEKGATPKPFANGPEAIHAIGGTNAAVVLWHGCEIDKFLRKRKPRSAFVGIAPLFTYQERVPNPEHQAAIRELRKLDLFPVPAFNSGGLEVSEGYVDLRYIWSVRQQHVAEQSRRVATMSDTLRSAFFYHLFTFFTRSQFRESVTCPHCASSIALDALAVGVEDEE